MKTGKILGETYIINGSRENVSGFIHDMSAVIYYEVVRLIDGKFLFLQDHLERLRRSLTGSGLTYPGSGIIRENLKLLQNSNSLRQGNIRICLQKNSETTPTILCYFIPYVYPDEHMYQKGVKLLTYPHVRPNPTIKKWDNRFRISVSTFIREQGVYEAILMNNRQEITEGSRSNIFFLDHQGTLLTAPEGKILAGITRKYILEICKSDNIDVIEKPIGFDHLDQMTACFISGTSPKILPVRTLDSHPFNVNHPQLRQIVDRFDTLIKENLIALS